MKERTLRSQISRVGFLHEECDTLTSAAAQGLLCLPLISMAIEDTGLFQNQLGLHLGLWWTP